MFINSFLHRHTIEATERLSVRLKRLIVACVSLCVLLIGTETLADPMRPPGYGAVSTTKSYRSTTYSLSQILISDDRKRAIINETLVSEGAKIDGAKVLKIEQDRVILRVDGKLKVLAINDTKGFQIKRETE